MMKKQALAVACAAMFGIFATESSAERIRPVEDVEDWTVYETVDNPRDCGVIALPSKTVNRRDGEVVSVRRDEIYLSIIVVSETQQVNAVSFQGGYPYRPGSKVTMNIDGREYGFDIGQDNFEGFAWPAIEDNAEVVDALMKGNTAVVSGISTRGTRTRDEFSLRGVTKSIQRAREACSRSN